MSFICNLEDGPCQNPTKLSPWFQTYSLQESGKQMSVADKPPSSFGTRVPWYTHYKLKKIPNQLAFPSCHQ